MCDPPLQYIYRPQQFEGGRGEQKVNCPIGAREATLGCRSSVNASPRGGGSKSRRGYPHSFPIAIASEWVLCNSLVKRANAVRPYARPSSTSVGGGAFDAPKKNAANMERF